MRERTRSRLDEPGRTGITTARLEHRFETLRDEVTTTVQPPFTARMVRRTVGRRRRRRGAVLGAGCVIAALALWSARGLLPPVGEGAAGGHGKDQRIAAEIPLPGPVVAAGPGSPPAAAPDDADLLLPVGNLPIAEGSYGPWLLTGVTGAHGSAAATATTDSATAAATDTAAATATTGAASAGPGGVDTRPTTCLGRVAGSVGAVSLLERSFSDVSGYGASAAEYVLVFASRQEAADAAARLRAPTDCGFGPVGVTALACSADVAAVLDEFGRVAVEEITVQQVGVRLVAMAVHRLAVSTATPSSGRQLPQSPQALVLPEFYRAAADLRSLLAAAPGASASPALSPAAVAACTAQSTAPGR